MSQSDPPEYAHSAFPGINAQHNEVMGALADIRAVLTNGLNHLNRRIEQMAVDVSKLGPAVQAIKDDVAAVAADVATVGTDVQAVIDKLSGISTGDPATQAVIDQAVADLGGSGTALTQAKSDLDAIATKATAATA